MKVLKCPTSTEISILGNSTGDKKEKATPQKLKKAREQGRVPKSRDFVSAISFTAGFLMLIILLPFIITTLKDYLLKAISVATQSRLSETRYESVLTETIPTLLSVFLPFGISIVIASTLANLIQTGPLFTTKIFHPRIERLNPWVGLKNLISPKRFAELTKNILKVGIVGWLACDVVKHAFYDLVLTIRLSLYSSIIYSSELLFDYIHKTAILFISIGCADLWWSRWIFHKDQRMSVYEVIKEHKQDEGDPQVKGQRRKMAQEILFSREQAIKRAAAVVTNPTQIAVAIQYEKDTDSAPRVVAKGTHRQAEKIRSLALKHHVPILSNIPLARALNQLELDSEIPEELFEATAEVLAYVYRLRELDEPPKP
ncbi:MAG: EscU/YscU/HrcU family type III secretion system export apparatus switch protein [Myxococcales bacterium]|nr:EscU/YscU/HrcU family type III secretion system export apparatus switch protein [Myxococcales bacterium]